jgi:two-component system chemotaxis sensor kinase CheA
MGQLVHEAVTGETAETNVIHVMAYLMGAPKEPEQAVEHGNAEHGNGKAILLEPVQLAALSTTEGEQRDTETWQHKDIEPFRHATPSLFHAPKTSLPSSAHRINTIRVETAKLDTLMTQSGELTVTKTRINHRLVDIEELLTLWEDWNRDASTIVLRGMKGSVVLKGGSIRARFPSAQSRAARAFGSTAQPIAAGCL